jgi:hypothetical protein
LLDFSHANTDACVPMRCRSEHSELPVQRAEALEGLSYLGQCSPVR